LQAKEKDENYPDNQNNCDYGFEIIVLPQLSYSYQAFASATKYSTS
jgi:hypothetical protein